jgi:hypothetical protein
MLDLEFKLGGHEKFRELCALYSTGSLSELELADLREHIETCEKCRTVLAEYRQINRNLIPLLAEEERVDPISSSGWQQEEGKQSLFAALDNSRNGVPAVNVDPSVGRSITSAHGWGILSRLHTPVPVVASLVLIMLALTGRVSYFAGFRNGVERSAHPSLQPQSNAPSSLVSNLLKAQTGLVAEAREREAKIESLSGKISEQSTEIGRLKDLIEKLSTDNQQTWSALSVAQTQQAAAATNHDALEARLKDAQNTLTTLQGQLRQTVEQRTSDLMQTTTLQRRIDELTARLSDKDSQVQEQETLLSSDRDIRELMGARSLFIADVFDVGRDGKTKTPFGRVFYTKNKSLVFYAFDLDKQRNAQNKNVAFQAWGLNDSDKHHPLNLGIFYIDSEANRRWALKFDNPAILEKINAVFVTVEPSGGSTRPSGKQLLYAYLEAQPNHP